MLTGFGLKMLNREAASRKNKPELIIKNLDIKEGMVVGDIGAGGGYFTHKFSKAVGETGKVYAIDVNLKFLDFISNNFKKEGIRNIETVLLNSDGSGGINLAENTIDLLFLRNVFHHLSEPVNYFNNIRKFLKNSGKIAIIDYNRKGFSLSGFTGHYTPENVLLETMDKAGFSPVEKFEFLPSQLFIIFEKS